MYMTFLTKPPISSVTISDGDGDGFIVFLDIGHFKSYQQSQRPLFIRWAWGCPIPMSTQKTEPYCVISY